MSQFVEPCRRNQQTTEQRWHYLDELDLDELDLDEVVQR